VALQAQGTGAVPTMMPKDAHPTFEVATIKPSDPNSQNLSALSEVGRHISFTNQTVKGLIVFAYGMQEKQLADAPAWLETEKYDLQGVPDIEGTPNLLQIQEMFRKLLVDRFHLKTHMEKRDLAVYALTVSKNGPKISKSQGDPTAVGTTRIIHLTHQLVVLKVMNASLEDFLRQMKGILDRPLVDQTNLTGKFDFTLQWEPDESQLNILGLHVSQPADNTNAQPGLFTAIQEQLGLKLDAVKAPADVLAIDHVDQPSAD
jgi:uncharacterized protein (TIGR03435 family)